MNSYRYYKRCCNDEGDSDDNKIQITENDNNDMRQSYNMTNNQNNNSCMCGFDMNDTSPFPSNPMYGQSYVPIQVMNKVFNPETGLKMGTIFPELVSPYSPCQGIREIEFIKNSNEIGEGCNG